MEKSLFIAGFLSLLSAGVYFSKFYEQNDHDQFKIIKQYQEWQQKYNKRYPTQNEQIYRFSIYQQNIMKIEDFNSQNNSYKQKINKFGDLTDQEFLTIYLNLQMPARVKNIQKNEEPFLVQEEVDWVQKGKVPAIKDQGDCGSCWAFSAVGALEINTKIQFNEIVDLSEQDLVDCAGPYGNAGCDGGWMESALDYIIDSGIAETKVYPYKGEDGICKSVERNFRRVIGYVDLDGCQDISNALIQQSVSVGVDATNWRFYSSGVFSDCKKYLNHGVVLVGINKNGVWKVRNSWGQDWGEQGYINLASGDTCGVCLTGSYAILK
ncbi:unnamed protein product (macronuclear) [Paramecium tetraurelia]|uniref:cathepsin L n=1 Tax=Paramecium tetraurelia TaxID=5888 RepID=A0CPL8_PARTE|nr:uncharacterized protein GSPATT00009127001 [Paramecium tetraurelia]CAK72735.1 unnamed protein product [Paramecium tetraurelia]|eukprot:XP_001440132.1 hypothetical protein (macronuclear) [Paramecium tetraurelia strain d4-2]